MSKIDWDAIDNDELITEVRARMKIGTIEADDLGIDTNLCVECGEPWREAGGGIDMHLVDEAHSRFICRDYREALWCLEKALGNEFAGLSDLLPEARS